MHAAEQGGRRHGGSGHLTQWLTHAHRVALRNLPLKVGRRLKHQDDGRPESEATHGSTGGQLHTVGIHLRGHIAAAVNNHVTQPVCLELGIEVQEDVAHVCCRHGSKVQLPVAPPAAEDHTLVHGEDIVQAPEDRGTHGQQLAGKVPALCEIHLAGRMDPVVATYGQVEDDIPHHGGGRGLGLHGVQTQERRDRVRGALHLLHPCF
mmetsp:Transcript_89466/g.253481  ORF Transcript_89466/g.253481 Transcript_89466/m.253481 type:complete len:206 (+) Transcript_89466:124-741(+)